MKPKRSVWARYRFFLLLLLLELVLTLGAPELGRAAFPVAGVFLKKGVSLTNVFIFLGAWSTTKVPMMLFETTQLGGRFALLRFCMNVVGIVLLAVIMEKTTSPEEAEAIRETAIAQTEHK